MKRNYKTNQKEFLLYDLPNLCVPEIINSALLDDIFKIEDMIERLDETFMSYDKLDTTQNASISIEDTVIHEELLNELYNILKLKLNKKLYKKGGQYELNYYFI